MTYHDGEVLTYAYDSGGLPRAATGKKLGITYPYVEKLEYDKFEQRAFLREGNGVETAYTYNPLDRRLDRLQAGAPNDPNGDFQDLSYSYDDVGNILKLDNTAKIPKAGDYGGPVTQTFQYDGLYRLTNATGEWKFAPGKKSVYSFSQSYNTIHNITKKTQTHDVETPGGATVPQKKTSYDLSYSYTSSHPHAPTKIAGTDDVHKGGRTFEYDKNGNQLGFDVINSGQKRSIVWDEENRIQEIHDNGRTSRFKYNDAGERVIKRTEQGETAYVNQFWTVRNRSVGTKHIFVGETRIASKLVPGEDHVQPESLWSQTLGGWWKQLSQGQKPFKNPHFTGSNMPQKLPEDNFVYFYHPDHVGSTSYVTDKDGELYEHVQYFPFGETWVHEHSNTEKMPYLYTSKELDEETGLYYFGARYYDPRTSVWQSADAQGLVRNLPVDKKLEFAVGLDLFSYARNNPLMFVDPDGRDARVKVQGRLITVSTTIWLTGPHASPKVAKAMQDRVTRTWGNPNGFVVDGYLINFDIKVRVKTTSGPVPAGDNSIAYNPKAGRPYVYADRRSGKWSNPSDISHEFGHLVGLINRYSDVVDMTGVNITEFRTQAGYEGQIMAEMGGRVNYDALSPIVRVARSQAWAAEQQAQGRVDRRPTPPAIAPSYEGALDVGAVFWADIGHRKPPPQKIYVLPIQ